MSHGMAMLKAAAAGMARRLMQTVVVFMVLATAATAAVVALTLASTPTLAFQAASTRYHSADLAVTIDAAKVTSAQLARTRRLPGVTNAVGYPATTVSITIPGTPGYQGDDGPGTPVSGPVTMVGRAMRNIRQNLVLAFGYNTAGIPIAAGLLYPVTGIVLSPMIAGGGHGRLLPAGGHQRQPAPPRPHHPSAGPAPVTRGGSPTAQ